MKWLSKSVLVLWIAFGSGCVSAHLCWQIGTCKLSQENKAAAIAKATGELE
jgi:hypothetical protein